MDREVVPDLLHAKRGGLAVGRFRVIGLVTERVDRDDLYLARAGGSLSDVVPLCVDERDIDDRVRVALLDRLAPLARLRGDRLPVPIATFMAASISPLVNRPQASPGATAVAGSVVTSDAKHKAIPPIRTCSCRLLPGCLL